MSEKFKFKLSTTTSSSYVDAEALFRDLKNRDPEIQHLWSHQADIIRAYHKDIDHIDIALELPTGAGKTLVGLLIAEWRRLSLQERVAYLCPTRQLAYQVGLKAEQYGVNGHVLVGPQNEYPVGHFSDYASAKAIAITTYSGLFNTNPKIDNPETLILDDAHAGENYISKMWSLSISRSDQVRLYEKVIDLYSDELPDYLLSVLKDDDANPIQKRSVDLLPAPKFLAKIKAFMDLLDASIEGTELSYSWLLIRDRLSACHAFFSWSEIMIRPWIPPSLTHPPFTNAKQRIYMSATLGAGGELERIAGVPKIHRIPVPRGWDKQSTGRRLFVFPDRSFSSDKYMEWLTHTINSNERVLVLTPHSIALNSFLEGINQIGTNHRILQSKDVEENMDTFINTTQSVLALTNRYDGLDLPGESCRLLVVFGLPASVNLQERFLWSKLGLSVILRDRIRTRITQAVGRCTRNSTDFACVIMADTNLFEFCIKRENREGLHPELRAEMDFGLDNSETDNIDDLKTLIELFLRKEQDWESAEKDITTRRDETVFSPPSYVQTLYEVVKDEVNYQYDLWKEDYDSALSKATTIADRLSGNELAGYRALWNYFAGCTAHRHSEVSQNKDLLNTATDRFRRSSKAVSTVSWFARLSHELNLREQEEPEIDYLTIKACEVINEKLTTLGTIGTKFDKVLMEYEDGIKSSDPNKFDKALTELGSILGFYSERPENSGAPDSVWSINGNHVLLFECKSDETPNDGISISTCRQAKGHIDWQKARPFFTQNAKLSSIVVSPRKFLDQNAVPHADGLYYIHIDDVRSLFSNAIKYLRIIRSKATDLDTTQRLELIQNELSKVNLIPEKIITLFTSITLNSLEKK